MRADIEHHLGKWVELSVGMKTYEIEDFIAMLVLLKTNQGQHFHLRSNWEGNDGVGDIEFYLQSDDQKDNMQIVGLAIQPNR